MTETHCCHAEPSPAGIPALGKKLRIVGGLFIVVLLVSFLPGFEALNDSLLEYLRIVWWAVLLGLVIGGSID